jgi:hypothetical protein
LSWAGTICIACSNAGNDSTRAAAFAGDDIAETTDPGVMPNSGQINRGFDEKLPSLSQPRPIPMPAEARVANTMTDSDQSAVGSQGNDPNANATTGSA